MSREIRRVPVGWRHPVEHNPHWLFQRSTPYGQSKPESRLHGPTERFVSLSDDYPGAVASWEQDVRDMEARTGFDWEFALRWHITGYDDCSCHPAIQGIAHPYVTYAEDGGNRDHHRTRRLRVESAAGKVYDLAARQIAGIRQAIAERAEVRAERGLEAYLQTFPIGTLTLVNTTGGPVSDWDELAALLPRLEDDRLDAFFAEAQSHLLDASRCADGDPVKDEAMGKFRACITDALRADAEAAGR